MTEPHVDDLLLILAERLTSKESLEIEYKSAIGGLPKSIWPTISAFANTIGGWILLGFREEGKKIIPEGLGDPETVLENFYNLMRNTQKISYPVCSHDDATVEEFMGRKIIIIRVPEIARQKRPVYILGNPYGGTFVRRNTGDYTCTKPEVDRMMREASDVGADSLVLPSFTIDDIDVGSLAQYRRLYQTLNPGEVRNSYTDVEFLRAIRGYGRNRDTGQQGLTVAGLLLLGKENSIREWRTRHIIDYRSVDDENDLDVRWSDRVVWEGNLLGAFGAIYPRLSANILTPFRLEGVARIDQSPMHVVLREALINLLVHADYATQDSSLVVRTPSNFLFRNPGSSRVSEFDLLNSDRSDPRNPELVRMFRFIGLAEEAGTGIPKIIRAWREMGMVLPLINAGTERYEFSLNLRQAHFLSDDDRQWLQNLGSGWSEAEQIALVHIRNHGEIDHTTLVRLTGMHPADISKVLQRLKSRQILDIVGLGRSSKYILKDNSEIDVSHTDKKPVDTSVSLWEHLLAISSPIREARNIKLQTVKDIIVELCSISPLATGDLSQLLERNSSYITTKFIKPLLEEKRVQFLYPERPSHPGQKYITVIQVQDNTHSNDFVQASFDEDGSMY